MEKGLAIIEVTDTETRGFYIDQDALEFARLNALTKKHLQESEEAEKDRKRNRRKAEKANARRKAYALDSTFYVLLRIATVGALAWAWAAEMISPIICIPVGLFCLCTACLRLGALFGKRGK